MDHDQVTFTGFPEDQPLVITYHAYPPKVDALEAASTVLRVARIGFEPVERCVQTGDAPGLRGIGFELVEALVRLWRED